jgi:hypothetical protein
MTIHESRVDSMGVTSEQLVVDHYDEPTDTWTRLDSCVVGTANGYVTLEVQTPHFSLFVISADWSVASPSTAGPTPDATDGSGDSAGEDGPLDDVVSDLVDVESVPDVDVDVDAAEVAPETVPGPDETVGAAVVALLLALVAVGVGLRRR